VNIQHAWLAAWNSPYLGLFLTLLSFQLGLWVFRKSQQKPWLHPVMVSVVMLCLIVWLTDLSFERYMSSAKVLSDLLGPVIVALAIPLYENLRSVRRYWLPFVLANVLGGTVTILVAVGALWLLGGSSDVVQSMWTKSITTAFALQIAPGIGAIPAIAAAIIMFTGIFGAIMAPALFRLCGITAPMAQGASLGICAHAVGTSKALELGSEQGAFAALSMSFMGILCALTLPVLLG